MTFPKQYFIDLVIKDPNLWITTERMISEDDENAYIELAYTDPKNQMRDHDLADHGLMYYTHKDDCCEPLPTDDYEPKFINTYEVRFDPPGVKRAEIRIIKHNK